MCSFCFFIITPWFGETPDKGQPNHTRILFVFLYKVWEACKFRTRYLIFYRLEVLEGPEKNLLNLKGWEDSKPALTYYPLKILKYFP